EFIRPLPHISFVEGEDNVDFLKRRFKALSNLPMFAEMAYSENPRTLNEWIPLMMKSRHLNEKIAATHVASGTDRSEEHTSELQSRFDLVCRLLLEKKKNKRTKHS